MYTGQEYVGHIGPERESYREVNFHGRSLQPGNALAIYYVKVSKLQNALQHSEAAIDPSMTRRAL